MENYKIITLCGSTKFKSTFEDVNRDLTLKGKIILQPGCFVHTDNISITEEQKEKLDILHKEKIKMSDCIFVLNINNYIGSSTISEINYAKENSIPIYYFEKIENNFNL